MRVVFLHPDLGIGGAERLVVDAAVALCQKGHRVSVKTGHHDRKHCFEETKDGTFYVQVFGSWIPQHIFGRLHAFLAYFKMIWIALRVCFSSRKPDVIFCDQVSACLLILKLFSKAKTVFYCHFPDKLLTKRETWIKWLYRLPLDFFEEWTTGLADILLVNSHFTAETFRKSFPSLKDRELHVLYPSLNIPKFKTAERRLSKTVRPKNRDDPTRMFLSINRYERKKNLNLAIESFAELRSRVTEDEFANLSLVMAGGYDERVRENVEHYAELEKLIESLGLKEKVRLLRSVSAGNKMELLRAASVVLYTPSHEHFGIVPIEAMFTNNPVIAVNNGGPCETVVDGVTGFLRPADKDHFADAMLEFMNFDKIVEMGAAGQDRVMRNFSFDSFTQSLNDLITSLVPERKPVNGWASGRRRESDNDVRRR